MLALAWRPATAHRLTPSPAQHLTHLHSSNVPEWERRLRLAEAGEGETVFDMLVEIIRDHGAGGAEAENGVELVLEA